MTPFLLAGTRPVGGAAAEPGLAATARQVVAASTWQGWLRRWGLLAGYGLSHEPATALRVCLVVRASNDRAAERLARHWERITGYRVTVLPFTGEPSRGPFDPERDW
jgi:hypothetical protein